MQVILCFSILDMDAYAVIDFKCTYKGAKGTFYDPPEAPEFEVESIELFEDVAEKNKTPKPLALPKWLAETIEQSDKAQEAMCEAYSKEMWERSYDAF